ncbi:MAG: NTP transferase domain-containing protein [Melioribacteraceae bacterium]|nr:NTP transferase domain-containing protein [Melioribacteraceae bacterium]
MKNKITGLLIAAGFSSRMGKFKPLLTYRKKSFLYNIVTKLDSVCDETIVITGHNDDLIEKELNSFSTKKRIKTIFNENYQDGMFTSLQTGLQGTASSHWVLYHFIDQPNLPNLFYKEFIAQIDDSFDWIQPKYNGKKGHPILLGEEVIKIILASNPKSNLKQISENHNIKKKCFDVKTKSIFCDVDTKEDYKTLIEQK